MSLRIIPKHVQASGAFNGGQIIENKPIGFPQDGGHVRPFSNLFYWARAEALVDSTIGLHPHKGFEIMSFVLKGRIRHYDTAHKEWRVLDEGDVQIIRAGNGIEHSEQLEKGAVIFQIWTDPNLDKTLSQPATYDDYPAATFPQVRANGQDVRTLIGENSPLTLDTPRIAVTRISGEGDITVNTSPDAITSLYILEGTGTIEGQSFGEDDFIILEDQADVVIKANGPVDVFRIDGPKEPGYPTYAKRFMK
jgi:redox-sensitive bicupin YhaK (pirin superfamily)